MEHTKGPWAAEQEFPNNLAKHWFIRDTARGIQVAEVYGDGNARLIAAAPDLLEACEGLLRLCQCLALLYYHEEGRAKEIDKAERAIAKAKGEK